MKYQTFYFQKTAFHAVIQAHVAIQRLNEAEQRNVAGL